MERVISTSKMVPEYREEAKKRIVEAGLKVMYEKGYCRTTMDDIAKQLGVSKPALYRYFKNKDELILESAKILQGQYRRVAVPQSPKSCPIATWINIFDQMMSPNLNEHALLLELFGISVHDTVIRDYSSERMKSGIEESAHTIANQQEDGLISPATDPRTLAIALLSVFNGMRVMILLGIDRDELRLRWIEIVRALFLGVGSGEIAMECPPDCPGSDVCNRAEQSENRVPSCE